MTCTKARTEKLEVEMCGLCGGDLFKKDNYRGAVLRLVAEEVGRSSRNMSMRRFGAELL